MSTFVSRQPCLSLLLPAFTISPLFQLPLYLLPRLQSHSFLQPYRHAPSRSAFHFAFCSSLTASCIDIAHFSTASLCLLFCFNTHPTPPRILCLLGDPLMTSSLLQLPWFQGEGTVITGSTNRLGAVVSHKKINKTGETRDIQRILLYYSIQIQFAGLCVCGCVCGLIRSALMRVLCE